MSRDFRNRKRPTGDITARRDVGLTDVVTCIAATEACFDCAIAVDGSLETHVHPRRDRGEPCAPKLNSCLACWGRGSIAVRGGHISKAGVSGKARGIWARPDVRPFGLYTRPGAARQAGAAVLSFGDDPARERRRFAMGSIRSARRDPRVRAGQGDGDGLKGREGLSPAVVETAAMAQTDRTNVYQDITNAIIADLERGCVPWAQPWDAAAGAVPFTIPHNASTLRPYSGINILTLWSAVAKRKFTGHNLLTFRQALAVGGNVRKGARGVTVVYADRFTPEAMRERARETGDAVTSIEGKNHDRNPMGEDHLEVGVETRVGPVRDEVDGVGNVAALQRALDRSDIGVEASGRARVERRHRADDPAPALRDHQPRCRSDEHRACHDGQSEPAREPRRKFGVAAH